MKTKRPSSAVTESELSFEAAIERLEKIVAEMENADLPLEQLLQKYEEGIRLVQLCTQKLDEAEKKIEILTRKPDGTVERKPFQPTGASTDTLL
ncbi:MAG: exodeoxyribonuclease VII small subunit [Verrucomicrobiae bacterium]|nr:exodeoxyribonuclease VII small subunit [Verrucomicrobiae bacterium]